MSEFLFSYGTLQKEKVQQESFGRILKGSKDVLKGYKLSSLEIKDKSVLSKSDQKFHPIAVHTNNLNDSITGMIFEITEDELFIADTYEVEDYVRVSEIFESGKAAWVYVAKKEDYSHYSAP